MMTEQERLLIAASLDGDLSPVETATVRQLLATSEDARILHVAPERNRLRLAALPRHAAPKSVAPRILAAIRPAAASTTRVQRVSRGLPYAVAASLLIGCIGGSFWIFTRPRIPDQSDQVVQKTSQGSTNQGRGLEAGNSDQTPKPPGAITPELIAREPTDPPAVRDRERLPIPRPDVLIDPNNVFSARIVPELPPLQNATARIPFIFPMAEIGTEEWKKQFLAELEGQQPMRLDLFVRDSAKAVELLMAAGRASGVAVSVSAATQEQLKRKLPIHVGLIVETLTVEDWVKWLTAIKKLDSATPANSQTAHLLPVTASDLREVKPLLGFEPAWTKPVKLEADKPLSSDTINQLTKTVTKVKPALAFTFGPAIVRTLPALSPEIKLYQDRRVERAPGELPMLIIIRPAN